PSDARLMVKMVLLVHKVWTYMKQHMAFFADFLPCVDVKAVKAKARAYLFRDRKDPEHAQTTLHELWHEAFTQIHQSRKYFAIVLDDDIHRIPSNIRRSWEPVHAPCSKPYL